jgi:hypothetical protein
MNLVDDVFAASDWHEVASMVASRRQELFEDAARAALMSRIERWGSSEAARQLLDLYLSFFQAAARLEVPTLANIAAHTPKLTDVHFGALARVTDVPSARQFVAAMPDVALQLLQMHRVFGDPFWMLLLATSPEPSSAPPQTSEAAPDSVAKTTICLTQGDVVRRLFKVLPLSDGGFAVTAPYHVARSGALMKMPQTTKTGSFAVEQTLLVPFSASDRVKLSYHADGFVQFSGEGAQTIRSGRDRETGEPRGLGLIGQPPGRIQSGPSIICGAWDLEDFEDWRPRSSEHAIVFDGPEDFYVEEERDQSLGEPLSGKRGVNISIFPIPADLVTQAMGPWGTGRVTALIFPMNIYNRQTRLPVKLVRASPNLALAIIAKREVFGFEYSGFQLSGPGDGEHVMMALYPAPAAFDRGETLDYVRSA